MLAFINHTPTRAAMARLAPPPQRQKRTWIRAGKSWRFVYNKSLPELHCICCMLFFPVWKYLLSHWKRTRRKLQLASFALFTHQDMFFRNKLLKGMFAKSMHELCHKGSKGNHSPQSSKFKIYTISAWEINLRKSQGGMWTMVLTKCKWSKDIRAMPKQLPTFMLYEAQPQTQSMEHHVNHQ